ncbi:MAG: FecR domain-containing protein, partial [Pseudomonadota bacterium]
MNRRLSFHRLLAMTCALMLLPFVAHADAGKILFVYGKAYIQAPDGTRTDITRGDAVQSGDLLVTTANGRVQLRMSDGGLLALRPQTEFLIEDYNDPADNARTGKTVEEDSPRSFFALLKGGFRSITGAIGQERKSDYRVKTPVATIGIRGTDYTAVVCAGDCGSLQRAGSKPIADGLYIGVAEGGVVLINDSGTLDLDAGQFGFVADAESSPESSVDAESVLTSSTSLTAPAQAEEQAPAQGLASNETSQSTSDADSDTTTPTAEVP